LGLAIAQAIAKKYGGLITVKSELGVGTCFTIRLLSNSQFPK
jgi:signal transduction histidine kinase